MPNVIETHGPGKHPFVTVGNAFKALAHEISKPDSVVPNMERSNMSNPDRAQDILQLHKVAGTIRCGGRAWHPTEKRCISVREAATLQSYPAMYEFLGSLTDQYKQVGNAVPGQMAKAVALAVANSLRYFYDEELAEESGKQKEQLVDTASESEGTSSDGTEPCDEGNDAMQDETLHEEKVDGVDGSSNAENEADAVEELASGPDADNSTEANISIGETGNNKASSSTAEQTLDFAEEGGEAPGDKNGGEEGGEEKENHWPEETVGRNDMDWADGADRTTGETAI
jgi:C-5 cytosine-specific DNA methylase